MLSFGGSVNDYSMLSKKVTVKQMMFVNVKIKSLIYMVWKLFVLSKLILN